MDVVSVTWWKSARTGLSATRPVASGLVRPTTSVWPSRDQLTTYAAETSVCIVSRRWRYACSTELARAHW